MALCGQGCFSVCENIVSRRHNRGIDPNSYAKSNTKCYSNSISYSYTDPNTNSYPNTCSNSANFNNKSF